MKIYNIASSTVFIESNTSKILMDPWFVNGEYYGSWHHTHEIEVDLEFLNSATHIYISHIHPDHFGKKSMEKLDKNIPVLIHDYSSKFLKLNIERLGFKVIEIGHNKEFKLDSKTKIKILAADNCNPELCSKFMGCSFVEKSYKTTQIDSMSLIYNDNFSILNTNDCPYDLATETLDLVCENHNNIDLLLVGYAGAGPYPQCFILDHKKKIDESNKKRENFLNQGVKFINKIKPKFYMPFAGTYMLGGKFFELNDYRGVPEIHEALDYYKNEIDFSNGFLLNQYQFFDLKDKKISAPYRVIDEKEHKNYIERVKNYKLEYETDNFPTDKDITDLIPKAFNRFLTKKNEINFFSVTTLIIEISDTNFLVINLEKDASYKLLDKLDYGKIDCYVKISLDRRLFFRILKGPRYAHWNNAEIGSHLTYERNPNIFERGLYHSLCFLHS